MNKNEKINTDRNIEKNVNVLKNVSVWRESMTKEDLDKIYNRLKNWNITNKEKVLSLFLDRVPTTAEVLQKIDEVEAQVMERLE